MTNQDPPRSFDAEADASAAVDGVTGSPLVRFAAIALCAVGLAAGAAVVLRGLPNLSHQQAAPADRQAAAGTSGPAEPTLTDATPSRSAEASRPEVATVEPTAAPAAPGLAAVRPAASDPQTSAGTAAKPNGETGPDRTRTVAAGTAPATDRTGPAGTVEAQPRPGGASAVRDRAVDPGPSTRTEPPSKLARAAPPAARPDEAARAGAGAAASRGRERSGSAQFQAVAPLPGSGPNVRAYSLLEDSGRLDEAGIRRIVVRVP